MLPLLVYSLFCFGLSPPTPTPLHVTCNYTKHNSIKRVGYSMIFPFIPQLNQKENDEFKNLFVETMKGFCVTTSQHVKELQKTREECPAVL